MGLCISNLECMSDSLTTLEDHSPFSQSNLPQIEDLRPEALNSNQPEQLPVKNNIQIEIKELPLIQRPMLRRSLTVIENPSNPKETPKKSSIINKISRTNPINGKHLKKSSFLGKAKEKLRRVTLKHFYDSRKDQSSSPESTEMFKYLYSPEKIKLEVKYLSKLDGEIDPEAN